MKLTSKIHIAIVILTLLFVTKLEGQQRPEMVPYRVVPNDYYPDSKLEFSIELIHPYNLVNAPPIHQEEVYEIIYSRIEFEILNPQYVGDIFVIDQTSYYLIRVPYTGSSWNSNRSW